MRRRRPLESGKLRARLREQLLSFHRLAALLSSISSLTWTWPQAPPLQPFYKIRIHAFEFFLEQNFFWSDFWISPLSFLFLYFYTILGLISTESYKEFFGTKSTAFSVLFTLFTCFLWAHAKQANTNRPKTVLKKIWISM